LRPAVRVAAERLTQLVADLDSPQFAVRQRAEAELSQMDEQAEAALREALTGQPPLELRQRVEKLLDQLKAVPTPEQLRQVRAIEVLEQIGTADAQAVLQRLAAGSAARPTREAQAALERLRSRPAAQDQP